jgi:hypothetical protein
VEPVRAHLLLAVGLAAGFVSACAQEAVHEDSPVAGSKGPVAGLASTPTAAFDHNGRLWAVWVEASNVWISASADLGRTFEPAVRVTKDTEPIDANSESRPKIAFTRDNAILVSWTRKGTQPYTGDIRFARSVDGGQTFSTPITINDGGPETGRFDALHVGPSGRTYLAWIDKRDMDQATKAGQRYTGAALYLAESLDGGATFLPNRKLKDHVCECCRLAIAFDGDVPVIAWRDVINGTIRDHALLRFTDPATPGPPIRATHDNWHIDACPHHGPGLSIGDDGTYHLVWFTGEGPGGTGAFYARSTDRGRNFSAPLRLGPQAALAHAVVLARSPRVVLAWMEAAGAGRLVRVRQSSDGGLSWSDAAEAAATSGASDYPLLITRGSEVFLSWFTPTEGYRLIPIQR